MGKIFNGFADLHIHSTVSDGLYSPSQVVDAAVAAGLKAIALTDHDNVGGIEEARKHAERFDIEVIAGSELSSYIEEQSIHIVGLFINHKDGRLLEHLEFFREHRLHRGEKMVNKLIALGVKITIDDVLKISGSGSVGRPHIAQALVDVGAVKDTKEAFQVYIGNGKPAYEPKFKISPAKAAEIIHAAGGVAFFAHPGVSAKTDEEIRAIMKMGLDGIETVHSKHPPEQVAHLTQLANVEGWLISGGSDCHGKEEDNAKIGKWLINAQYIEKIRNFRKSKTSNIEGK